MLFYQILPYNLHGKIKEGHTFELPDGSYSVSDIQEYFEYIFKNMDKRLIILL